MAAPMYSRANKLHLFRKREVLKNSSYCRYLAIKHTVNTILQLPKHTEPFSVHVKGWVKSVRARKEWSFLHLTDGSGPGLLQIVIDSELCKIPSYGSCVSVEGTLVPSPAKGQLFELKVEKIKVIGDCDPLEFPFKDRQRHTEDYVRQYPHLRPKTDLFSSLLRVRNSATFAVHKFFQDHGFLHVHAPMLTSNDCEGAGEVFEVNAVKKHTDEIISSPYFFGHPVFLSVSGQLHLEAMTGGFPQVYTFSPTFRADHSRTAKHHLSEFYMVEGEMAFMENLESVIQVMEDLIKFTTKELLDKSAEDVNFYRKRTTQDTKDVYDKLLNCAFIRLPYSDAVEVLKKKNDQFQFKVSYGVDFQKEHEKYLVSHFGDQPVFVINFPKSLKPFYARSNEDGETVAAVDLLMPGVGELCGGSLREERHDVLEQRLRDLHLAEQLQWYLDLRSFGSAPHGGFGMGFERYLQCILGAQNIRDVIPFPRYQNSCKM